MLARGAIHNPGIFREYKDNYHNNLSEIDIDNIDNIDNDNYEVKELEKSNSSNNISTKQELKKKGNEEDDVQLSNRLTTILHRKYGKEEIDIMKYVRDYVNIVITKLIIYNI